VVRHQAAWLEIALALPFGGMLALLLRAPLVSALFARLVHAVERRHKAFGKKLGLRVRGRAKEQAVAIASREPTAWRAGVEQARYLFGQGLATLLAVAIVGAIFVQNSFLAQRVKVHRGEWMISAVEYPRLLQGWSMFAPEPPYEDGRVVIDGRTADGRKLDPFTGKEPSFSPHAPSGWGHSQFDGERCRRPTHRRGHNA
jgi:hypothetical protein